MDLEKFVYNGLDARTGDYAFPPQTPDELAEDIAGRAGDDPSDEVRDHLLELQDRVDSTKPHFGVKAGVDAGNLAEAGWGVVFPAARPNTPEARAQEAILEALRPLLEHRRAQASQVNPNRFRIYRGELGYMRKETKQEYLARLGAGPGPADPDKVPYYLMVVASPEELPFNIQYQIDVQYAVGRLHFDSVEDYAHYARSVVAAETGEVQLARELATFAVANHDDAATQLSAENLVAPLAKLLEPKAGTWKLTHYGPGHAAPADKANLARLLGDAAPPALLFTASHGASFPKGDPLQRRCNGALICQDWPGPVEWSRKPLSPDFYFSADDVTATRSPHGLIVFNFACYGGGTPLYNDYGDRAGATKWEEIADAPFVSALHQRLLAHPKGGALAAVGHVERAWGCSFMWPGTGRRTGSNAQMAVFESAFTELLAGKPIGAAIEWFNQRYAELASDLTVELREISFGRTFSALKLADMWTANNDARGYAIAGDPAVRVAVAPPGAAPRRADLPPLEVVATPTPATATATPADAPATPAVTPRAGGSGSGYDFSVPAAAPVLAELARALGNDGTLTVRTWAAADVAAADAAGTAVGEHARLQAVTRVRLDGDVEVVAAADLTPALAQVHAHAVQQAQSQREALIRALLAKTDVTPR
jgi:hypothetical protein